MERKIARDTTEIERERERGEVSKIVYFDETLIPLPEPVAVGISQRLSLRPLIPRLTLYRGSYYNSLYKIPITVTRAVPNDRRRVGDPSAGAKIHHSRERPIRKQKEKEEEKEKPGEPALDPASLH